MSPIVLDRLSERAKTVLSYAVEGLINAETISYLTRQHLLATPGCGPRVAAELIKWARSHGIEITD